MKKIFTFLFVFAFVQFSYGQPNYNFSSGTTTFTALSGASAFTWNTTIANDEEYSAATNIGFTFNYDGTAFTQFQVSTNGFLEFGSSLVAATPTDALNGALRNILAPLWDDLAVTATSTDITYLLSGTTPNQVLTIEWNNIKWNKTALSANAQFQIKLYEADGKIEYVYGTMAAPTLGLASIGLNDATVSGTWGTFQSINVGGSGTNFHVSMVYVFNSISTAPASNTILTFSTQTISPLSGSSYTVGASGSFSTPSQMAQALNLNGISGPVTITIDDGTYDDIIHLINVTGTSSTNTITIQKQSSGVTLSPRNGSRNGSTSTTADFVVAMLGTDYTTFDGIDITHNSSNGTGTTQFEFGYWMANFTGTDGTQYNIIKNTVITGSNIAASPTNFRGFRTSGGGFTAVTASSGTVSNNTFKNFRIQQCGIAIYISGMNGTYPDVNNLITADAGYTGNITGYNDIGGITISTTASGIRGIFIDAQDNILIERCEVRNINNTSAAATTQDVTGIGTFTVNTSYNITIQNNIVHGLSGAGTATQVVYGIWLVSGTNVTVKNNLIYDLQGGTAGNAGTVRGILHNISSTVANSVYLINNMVYDLRNPLSQASNYAVRCIELNSADGVFMYNNTLYLDAIAGTGANFFATACLYIASSSNMELDYRNNIMVNKSGVSSSATSKAICLAKSTATIGTQINTTTNNNLLYAGTADSKHLIAWDAAIGYQTLVTYQTFLGSPRELNAIVADPGFVDDLTPGYNLHISTASWIPNGQGIPIASVTTDYDGNARSTSLVNGPIDIGADEYTPSTASATTTEVGIIGDGFTTTYTGVDGKTIAKITWAVGTGTLPTSVSVNYTPGAQATGTTSPSIYRNFNITEIGGIAGWNAGVQLYYNSSTELNSFTEANMRINKKDAGIWSVLSTTINTTDHYGAVNVTSFSDFSFDDGVNPLPVELTSFTASVIGSKVKLSWQTATEINNYGFEILRQAQDNKEWTKIGFINGNGNSNSQKSYSFTDESVPLGKYSYRLKQIDNDGTFEFSSAIEVDLGIPKDFQLSQNYPNPFNPTTKIQYTLPVDAQVTLQIYSITGELMESLVSGYQTSGSYTFDFDGSNYASGTYIYRLVANDFVQTRKMTLVK